MNLQTFKAENPAYKDWDNNELALSLYHTYYRDEMPLSEFSRQIEFDTQIPASAPTLGSEFLSVPQEVMKGGIKGTLELGQSLGTGFEMVGETIKSTDKPEELSRSPRVWAMLSPIQKDEVVGLTPSFLKAFKDPKVARQRAIESVLRKDYLTKRIPAGNFLVDQGRKISDFWKGQAEEWQPSITRAGKIEELNVWDNPELLGSPVYWAFNFGRIMPSFLASIVPGTIAAKSIQAAGLAANMTPQVAAKLAKIGGMTVGGLSGGALEGTGTYRQLIDGGATPEEALRAAKFMTLFAAGLNSLSVGRMLEKAGPGFMAKVTRRGMNGIVEGITEGAEEPAEVVSIIASKLMGGESIPENVVEMFVDSFKDALTIAGPAALTGFAISGGGAVRTKTEGEKDSDLLDRYDETEPLSDEADDIAKQVIDKIGKGPMRTKPPTAEEVAQAEELRNIERQQSIEARKSQETTQPIVPRATPQETVEETPHIPPEQQETRAEAPAPEKTEIAPEGAGATTGWNITPMDRNNIWGARMDEAEAIAAKNTPRVEELNERFEEIRSKRDKKSVQEKKDIRAEIEKYDAEYGNFMADQENKTITEDQKVIAEARIRAKKAGVPEDSLDDFEEEFSYAISTERPYYETNYDKPISQIYDETLEEYVQKAEQPIIPGQQRIRPSDAEGRRKGERRQWKTRDEFEKLISKAESVEEARKLAGQMTKKAYTDKLTGLKNRAAYMEYELFDDELPVEQRKHKAVLDIDNFSWVNDVFGHKAGDEVLAKLGKVVKAHTDEGYRYGGEEFVITSDDLEGLNSAVGKIESIINKTELDYVLDQDATTKSGIKYKKGQRLILEGLGLSYGIDKEFKKADGKLFREKDRKLESGERAPAGEIKRLREYVSEPGKVRKDRRDQAGLKPVEKKAPKKEKPAPGSGIRTFRGYANFVGGINFLNFTGELRDMPTAVKYLAKKTGVPIDQFVEMALDDNWLYPGTTPTSLMEELRTDAKTLLSRDRITVDLSDKKEYQKSEAEKKFEKELAHEPEAPPEGEYVQINAEDLPMDRKLTLLEGKSPNGWDVYEVTEKDPFSITLEDGIEIELKPLDKVEVLKKDLPGKAIKSGDQAKWESKIRFYRSGKTKGAELPDGERVILTLKSTPKNFLELNRKFIDSLWEREKGLPKEEADELISQDKTKPLKPETKEVSKKAAPTKPVTLKKEDVKADHGKGLKYETEIQVQETGEVVKVSQPANEALRDIDERILSLKILRDCI